MPTRRNDVVPSLSRQYRGQDGEDSERLIALTSEKGYDADTKAGVIVEWLKQDFGLGRGNAMALVHVIKRGPEISDKHVGTTSSHRDDSSVLRLDGVANRVTR